MAKKIKTLYKCEHCGSEYYPYRRNQRFCSRECFQDCTRGEKQEPSAGMIRDAMDVKRTVWQSSFVIKPGTRCSSCLKHKRVFVKNELLSPDYFEVFSMVCVECYIIRSTPLKRTGKCFDCGKEISRRNLYCRSCGKLHAHGQFILDEETRIELAKLTPEGIALRLQEIKEEKELNKKWSKEINEDKRRSKREARQNHKEWWMDKWQRESEVFQRIKKIRGF